MNKINNYKLSKRILSLIRWIEKDSFVIDIGTDHAYLPIALVEKKITNKILAVDNNAKPLAKAENNIAEAGFENIIDLRLNNGLNNLEFQGDEIIVIAGMGGVLISNILSEAKNRLKINQKFILQPNWTWFELRHWLAKNGFYIEQEQVVFDQKKYYSQLLVKYIAKPYQITDVEAFCGFNIGLEPHQHYLKRLKRLASQKSKSLPHYSKIANEISQMLKIQEADHDKP